MVPKSSVVEEEASFFVFFFSFISWDNNSLVLSSVQWYCKLLYPLKEISLPSPFPLICVDSCRWVLANMSWLLWGCHRTTWLVSPQFLTWNRFPYLLLCGSGLLVCELPGILKIEGVYCCIWIYVDFKNLKLSSHTWISSTFTHWYISPVSYTF